MRFFLLVGLLFPFAAHASSYVLVCASPCEVDGTTQPAGTALSRVIWDGSTPFAPPGMNVVPDTGQTLYTPTLSAPTTISALAFIQRFTAAEQTALMAANSTWGVMIAAAGTIDVTNALLIAQMQAAVTAGALTQARVTQILNLADSSP